MIFQVILCWIIIISKTIIKVMAIDLSKQQALDANPKAMQQINFDGNLENNPAIFLLLKKQKKQF